MKKIGIITLSGHYNHGNRLQNFALQETLKTLGFTVETIWNEDCKLTVKLKRKFKLCASFILAIFNFKNKRFYIKRYKKFKSFSKKYIRQSKFKLIINKMSKKINNYYDYFVVGSDQIWNYTLFDITGKEFLDFSSYDKNIAYAPSLGISNIESKWKDFYIDNLKNIKYLSCREEEGAKIIRDLTNRECPVVLDPTMLLDKEEWIKIISKPEFMTNKKYILLYFLGNISEEYNDEIKRIAEEKNYEIINILDITSNYYMCDPSEFLYLIKNASLVCTDSFHASVFSIIFEIPFLVFDRVQERLKSMNSRLNTLLSNFLLEDRKFDKKINEEMLRCSFDKSKNMLKKKQNESIDYLKKSLDIR